MSQSSPSTQRKADSLPFIIPHSKSSHGPKFLSPNCFSTLAADFRAPSQMSRWTTSFECVVSFSTILSLPAAIFSRQTIWRLYQTLLKYSSSADTISDNRRAGWLTHFSSIIRSAYSSEPRARNASPSVMKYRDLTRENSDEISGCGDLLLPVGSLKSLTLWVTNPNR